MTSRQARRTALGAVCTFTLVAATLPAHPLDGQPHRLHAEGVHGALHPVQGRARVHQCTSNRSRLAPARN